MLERQEMTGASSPEELISPYDTRDVDVSEARELGAKRNLRKELR